MNTKDTKTLMTGLLNNDDETVNKIIGACFENAYKKELEKRTSAIFESIGVQGVPEKPVVG